MALQDLWESWRRERRNEWMTMSSHQEKEKVRHMVTEKYISFYYWSSQFLSRPVSQNRKTLSVILELMKGRSIAWLILNHLHCSVQGTVSLVLKFKSLLVTLPVANWPILVCDRFHKYHGRYRNWPFVVTHTAWHQLHRWWKTATSLHRSQFTKISFS